LIRETVRSFIEKMAQGSLAKRITRIVSNYEFWY